MKSLWFIFGLLSMGYAATPNAPQSGKRLGQATDCAGAVAFSAVANPKGDKPTKKGANDIVIFDTTLLDKSVGYSRESGIFTTHCPGLYQFTFSGYGDKNKFSLQKRPSPSTAAWDKIVETGPSGGTHTVFIDMEVGEQAAVFSVGGSISPSSQTFSGYRISKKI